MSDTPALHVYEVSLEVDAERVDELDDWLDGYARRLRELPGLTEVTAWSAHDSPEHASRVLLIRAESQAHLQDYRDNESQQAAANFSDAFDGNGRWRGRMLLPGTRQSEQVAPIPRCLNCGAVLGSQYCSQCGQRAQTRLISIWELISEAFGDLFNFDSRLWRTLIPLAIRPGLLTEDYLNGRRTHYMPPFRMYLVMSLAFFVIVFFDPREDLGILVAPATTAADQTAASSVRIEFGDTDDVDRDEDGDPCDAINYDPNELPEWLARRLTKERVEATCRNWVDYENPQQAIFNRAIDNIPTGLIVLLPVMALALLILYPLSRRYYVEHLLFVVHFHTFVFMLLAAENIFSRLNESAGLPAAIKATADFATGIYIPAYLYLALRRVYGQGRLSTALKWTTLIVVYVAGIGGIVSLAMLIAIFDR